MVPGYTGGTTPSPTYREVCGGRTGHVEVVKVEFNIDAIDLSELFAVFFATHDPTTENRQGNDVGSQYNSAIFYNSENQLTLATRAIEIAENSGEFSSSIVTSVAPLDEFFLAEDHHHNYFDSNSEAPYCNAVIMPKLSKFKTKFKSLLKD